MEKILNQILQELQGIKTDMTELKTDVKELKTDVTELKTDVAELKTLTSAIFDQTVCLTEFKTETKESLHRIEVELDTLEKVTAKNCYDITNLKLIK